MSIQQTHLLKQLESRRAKLRVEADVAEKTWLEAKKAFDSAQLRVTEIDQQIAQLSASAVEPVLTEHALLRYLERVKGLDLAQLKAEILAPDTVLKIKALKTCRLAIGGGVALIVDSGVVRTVETDALKSAAKGQKAKRRPGPKPAERRQLAADLDSA